MDRKIYKPLNVDALSRVDEKTSGQKSGAALISIISNSCLVVLKLLAGFVTGSVAIISEAVHSGLDLVASMMAYVSVKVADRPPDDGHPFGHGKAENLAALFEGLLILSAGGLVAWKAALTILTPQPLPELGLGALVMLVSATVNILVSRHLFQVGRRTESAALVADAWHLRTDVYTSLGVFVALGGIMLGSRLAPDLDLNILDPLCALLVALMILKAGFQLSWEAVGQLLDCSLSHEELGLILSHIQAMAPTIKGYSVQSRRSGSCRQIFMTLHVDGAMPVEEGHRLGDELAAAIAEHFPDSQISFHLEPE